MVTHIFQELCIFYDRILLVREIPGKPLSELPVPAGKREGHIAYHHFIEAVRIHPYPRKVHQPEIPEQYVQWLAITESSCIMESGIEQCPAPHKCLQTSSRLVALLQHGHLHSVLRQYIAAFKAAKAAADYYYRSIH